MIVYWDLGKGKTWLKLTTINRASIITDHITDEQHPSWLIFGPNRSLAKESTEELMLQLQKLMTNGEHFDKWKDFILLLIKITSEVSECQQISGERLKG